MPPNPVVKLAVITSPPFAENTYIAHLEGRGECIVVDPGATPEEVLDYFSQNGLTPTAFLITHGHGDHIAGNGALKEAFPNCPIVIGAGDAPKLTDARLNLSDGYGMPMVSPPADVLLAAGDVYHTAGFDLEVRETPGHSSGHIVFVWRGASPIYVFGGDVLFAGGIGRTDFPDGSFEQLERSIREQLYTLPDDTVVLPGHGPPTRIGQERRTNPFVSG